MVKQGVLAAGELGDASERNQLARWIAFGSCVLAGLSNEVSGGALSLSLRPAGAELHAGAAAMQLVMTLSKLMFGAFMLLGGLLGDTLRAPARARLSAASGSSPRRRSRGSRPRPASSRSRVRSTASPTRRSGRSRSRS